MLGETVSHCPKEWMSKGESWYLSETPLFCYFTHWIVISPFQPGSQCFQKLVNQVNCFWSFGPIFSAILWVYYLKFIFGKDSEAIHRHRQRNLLLCIISYTLEQEQVNWLPMAPTDTEIVSRGDSFNCSSHDKKYFQWPPLNGKIRIFFWEMTLTTERRSKLSI